MPEDYRARLIKFIEMHGNSELMGVLPEREWILRAPTLQRKLALTAKVQDEVGHAQLIYRVVEDLGKPREQCLADLVSGKSKPTTSDPTLSWGDVGVIAWLVDAGPTVWPKTMPLCGRAWFSSCCSLRRARHQRIRPNPSTNRRATCSRNSEARRGTP